MANIKYSFTADAQEPITAFTEIAARASAAKRAVTDYNAAASRKARTTSPEAQQAREAIKAQREQAAAAKAADRAEVTSARAAARERAKIERQKTTDIKAELRSRDRAEKEHGRQLAKFYAAEAKQRHRETMKYERNRVRDLKSFERQRDMGRGAGAGALFGGAAGLIAGGGLAATRALVSVVGPAVRGDLDAKTAAKKLSTSGRGAGKKAVDPDRLLQEAYDVAKQAPGVTAEQVLSAQARFTAATGDLDTARKMGRTFALTAKASDASLDDVASTAGAISSTFGITDEAGMQEAMAKLIFAGKAGAFEFSDLGANFQELAAAGSRFGLDKGTKGVSTLGGLAQIARMSTGSGSEASTAVQSLMSQLLAKGADTGDHGVAALTGGKKVGKKWKGGAQVFTDDSHTKARPIEDVLVDVIAGAKGDVAKLGDIFDVRGVKGASKLIESYNQAGGGEAGKDAMRALMSSMMNAGGNWSEVQKDAGANVTADDKFAQFGERAKDVLGSALTPVFEAMADNIGLLNEPLALLGEGIAIAADSLAELATFVSSTFGIKLGTDGPKPSENVLGELAATNTELAELEKKKEQSGGLTIEQKRAKRTLENRRVELRQMVGEGKVGADTQRLLDAGVPLEDTPEYIKSQLEGGPETAAKTEADEMHEGKSRFLGTIGNMAGNYFGGGFGSVVGQTFGAALPTYNDAQQRDASGEKAAYDSATTEAKGLADAVRAARLELAKLKAPAHDGPPSSP